MFIDSSKENEYIRQKLGKHPHNYNYMRARVNLACALLSVSFVVFVLVIANANVSAIVIVISNTNYCRGGEFFLPSSNVVLYINIYICFYCLLLFCCFSLIIGIRPEIACIPNVTISNLYLTNK